MDVNYKEITMQAPALCQIVNGSILDLQGVKIGVVNRVIDDVTREREEAIALAEQYKQLLYEHNIIQKPKTAEELNAELQSTLAAVMTTVQQLSQEVKELKGANHADTIEANSDGASKPIPKGRQAGQVKRDV